MLVGMWPPCYFFRGFSPSGNNSLHLDVTHDICYELMLEETLLYNFNFYVILWIFAWLLSNGGGKLQLNKLLHLVNTAERAALYSPQNKVK